MISLIVGLGNPGQKYAFNRHNVGFQCLDRLARAHGLKFTERKAKALLARGRIEGVEVVLAKPLTYMNLSGEAIEFLVRIYQLRPEDILVIYDDLDLPFGRIRLRSKGGAGGHKGMKSIIEHVGTDSIPRLRIGIGRPKQGDTVDYLLSDFTPEEGILIEESYERAIAAVERFLTKGIVAAMNEFN
jgi:PTH1 family peptidyl-tRNA hydrolase